MTIETLRKAKKDTIRTMMQFGAAHPVLKYPMFITTVIFIFVYNVFLHMLIQIHIYEKLARAMAVLLSFAVFFAGMDLSVLAVQTAGEWEGTCIVTGFSDLSVEVREQRVPLGTTVDELYLPDTLEAGIMQAQQPGGEGSGNEGTEPGGEGSGNEGTEPGGEGGDSGDAGTGDGNGGDAGSGDGNGDAGDSSDAETGDGSGDAGDNGGTGDGNGDTGNSGDAGSGSESGDAGSGSGDGGAESGTQSVDADSNTSGDSAKNTAAEWRIHTADFKLPLYFSENVQEELTVQTLTDGGDAEETASEDNGSAEEAVLADNGDAEDIVSEDGKSADEAIREQVIIEGVTWYAEPAYDGNTEGTYIFTAVLPEAYALAEGVSLPQITVRVEEEQPLTAAGELLQEILKKYFDGIAEDGIYDAILSMDEDSRLSLTADYEELIAAMTQEDAADERLQYIIGEIEKGLADAAAKMPIKAPVLFRMRAAAPAASAPIPLRRISGSGNAFVYHSFNETKTFTAGTTYAFLNGVYGYEDAVSSLGSGAILKATDENNNSLKYIRRKYGDSATVKVYVDVITKGKDFDHCEHGGLYLVPNSGTPTEYRYFCWAGGAQNCGPYYAYNYVKESLSYTDVSASLNDIEKQGSTDPKDYAVKVTFDGGRSMTLDAGSYTVQIPDSNSDRVNIIVSDSEGNQINTQFRMPLVVNYDGNGTGVSNVPGIQPAWKGESFTVSSTAPVRSGYSFLNWKEAQTGTTYTKGQRIASFGSTSLFLKAQWKDILAPTVGYTPTQVMTRATDAEVKAAVEAALTITDNEPVEECTVAITVPVNFAATAGNKDITVKVTDKAGNATTKICTVSVMSYVEFSRPQFTADTKNLSVILRNPGTDPVTESGFVWGIMNAPSLTINNGRKATASPVVKADGTISVKADNLQKGVTYYARAYIIADGVAYYSDEIEIGIGLPAYGTFTIRNNNNNTFTVTRSGGSEGTQTVYYRTVNGSAVGGTHFTHQASSLTFAAGVTSRDITISEQGVNAAYSGKPATAYTNADRTYSVQIYRVTGGGTLDSTNSAVRTMNKDSGYTVSRDVYDKEKERSVSTGNDNRWVVDRHNSQKEQVFFSNDRGYNKSHPDNVGCYKNFNVQRTMPDYGEKTNAYLKATADGYYYRLRFTAHEDDDAWAHIWIANHAPNSFNSGNKYNGPVSLNDSIVGPSKFTARWDITGDPAALTFPTAIERSNISSYGENKGSSVEGDYLVFGMNEEVNVWFGANGSDADKWYMITYNDWIKVRDVKEPQFVAVAPMADGLYKAGDTFTVSLIFDEIVDSQNSGDLNGVKVNTTWGQASYAGGANTNVLYFTGTIVGNAETTLKVNGFTNPDRIKDMCNNTSTTATASGSGSTTAAVDTAKPSITVTSQGIAGGTGTVKVVVNADQSKTNSLRYAWSDSASMPATGWVEAPVGELDSAKGASGLPLSIRKEPGSGAGNGKWYLHAIGTYSTTGATDYKYACVDFGTASAPATGSEKPSLSVSADNSAWVVERAITIRRKGGGTLQYRKSGASAWTTLAASAGSVTVTENGYYTFRLTAADNVLTQTIRVEKIDRVNPTASIGEFLESGSTQSPKAGIYTKITLPVTFADSGSGVKTVQYAWTNTQTTPSSSWNTLSATQIPAGKADLSYTATENTETTKYLHIKVTDNLNHSYTTKSSAGYRVFSQSAVTDHTPGITLTGAPTAWTNDMATLTWTLSNYSGKNYEVILPDGRKARSNAANGEIWAPRNGTYTVKVRDLDYGGENTATLQVTKIDTTAPTVTPSAVSGDWKKSAQTVSFSASDSQSGVGKKYYKIVDTKDEIPADGLTQLTSNSVSVTKDGVWYVYYKYYDKAGDDSIGREANKTEGFVGPVKIDKVSPTVAVSMGGTKNEQTGWYTAAVPATLTFSDPQSAESGSGMPGGVSSVKYLWVNTNTKPTSGWKVLTDSQIQTGSYVDTQTGNGIWYLYYQVTDAAGNSTDGFSEEIRLDTTKAALTVTGPAAGAEKRTGFTLTAQTGSFGASGGALSVKKDGQETETALKDSAGSGVLSAGYAVTEPGTYHFYSRTNADKSDAAAAEQTRYVHQAIFDSRGGSAVEPQLVWTSRADAGAGGVAECKVQKPADPEKRGLVFGGWYTDEKCENAFDFNSQIYGDTTLYAKWTADSYEVTYHLTNPDGSAYNAEESYREYTFGEGLTLPVPKQEGYQFSGWYLTEDYTGEVKTAIGEDETEARIYYAYYVDITAPKIAAQLSAESRESGWHTERPDINLTYSDNQGVKRLLVSVDGGEWQELSGFPMGSGIKDDTTHRWTFEEVQEGEHTYAFRVMDAAGLSAEAAPIRVKLDTVKPVFGDITYNEGYATLWDWLIRRDRLLVKIPVTEEGSGLAKVTYTLTPGSMQDAEPVTKEAKIEKIETDIEVVYTAVIAIDPDYKGVVGDIQAIDVAGNVSEEKTAYANGIGVIVEEQKPVITVTADRLPEDAQAGTKPEGEELSVYYYLTAPELLVKVQDGSMAASGIKEVKWRIGSGSEHTEDGGFGDVLKTEYGFRIALSGLTGTVHVEISAVDNAGNGESQIVTIKIKGKEQTPEAETDYFSEKLTGLEPGANYLICLPNGRKIARRADGNGEIGIDNGWFGGEITLIKKGDGRNTKDSDAQNLVLAARPAAPTLEKNDESIKGKHDGQVTGVTAVMEISRDGKKTWEKAAGTVTDAAPGKLWARVAATQTAPCGEAAFVTVKEGRTLTVTFDSQGGSTVNPVRGLTWKASVKKPADPRKAGDDAFCGWYREAAGNNKWRFAAEPDADLLTDDVTLWAKWLPKTDAPLTVGISYRNETLTELEPDTVYLIGGKEVTTSADGTVSIDESWFGKRIDIVRRGDGVNTGDSAALRLTVPNRPAGPVGVQIKAESAEDANDGKLTNTNSTMQYRKKGSTEWISITGEEITNLEPGDYELRYVSTDTAFSSKIVVKTVRKYGAPTQGGSSGGNGGGGNDGTTPGGDTTPGSDTTPGGDTTPGSDTAADDGKAPGSDTTPDDGTAPGGDTTPDDGTAPGGETTPNDGTDNGTTPDDSTAPGTGTAADDGKTTDTGEGTKPGDDTGDSRKPGGGTAPLHVVEDGRIVLEDADGEDTSGGGDGSEVPGSGANENGNGGTDGSGSWADAHPYAVGKVVETLTIPVNQGAVIVTVNNMDETLCTAQAADAVAVANAVLSQEHIDRVSGGETMEIRIDVERIDDWVSSQDKNLIEQGIETAQEEAPGLTVGMYVDISMFLRAGDGEWNAVHQLDEPVEIVIDMPKELLECTADFYIIRAHEGECTLLPDLDEAAETITIETERFSTYAIAYRLTDARAGRCGLCHICPTFLGICYFIWLILIAASAVFVVAVILQRRKKDEDDDKVM